jgi:hypothetical protein
VRGEAEKIIPSPKQHIKDFFASMAKVLTFLNIPIIKVFRLNTPIDNKIRNFKNPTRPFTSDELIKIIYTALCLTGCALQLPTKYIFDPVNASSSKQIGFTCNQNFL